MDTIPELERLGLLDDISDSYEQRYGCPPFNVSHWDPSEQLVRTLSPVLRLPTPTVVAPYLYPYELSVQREVLTRLGTCNETRDCLVVPTGTSAILFAVWWLKQLGVDHIVVVCPSYFPVFYAAAVTGLTCSHAYMDRGPNGWKLPTGLQDDSRNRGGKRAVWVTNPVYCTGTYLTGSAVEYLNSVLGAGVPVVLDECLALNGHELGPALQANRYLLGLYSPHKAVSLNAVKFAAISFDGVYRRFFTDWTDVLVGGLGASSYSAILHFLDENFSVYQQAFLGEIQRAREAVMAAAAPCASRIAFDASTEGYFITCYAPHLRSTTPEFLQDLVFATGATVIPGSRNHFPDAVGFSFRINLARCGGEFFGATQRLLRHLAAA